MKNTYGKIQRILEKADASSSDSGGSKEESEIAVHKKRIEESMDDDFNTAKAMGHLFDIAKTVNNMDENDNKAPLIVSEAKAVFDSLVTEVMGLSLKTDSPTDNLTNELMAFILELRQNARVEKNWALADTIRNRLKEIGIVLEDRADGTGWKVE